MEIAPPTVPTAALAYAIRHTFLPPKLPNGDDSNPEHEQTLLRIVLHSLRAFSDCVDHESRDAVVAATAMINSLEKIHGTVGSHLTVGEQPLREALEALPKKGELAFQTTPNLTFSEITDVGCLGGAILLHIVAQNAGVMISKNTRTIDFETFELSPTSEAVMSTRGRLKRSFPGYAVSLTETSRAS